MKITSLNRTASKGYSCDYMPAFLWNIMSDDRYNKKPRPLNRKLNEKPVAILRCLCCEGGIIKNITLSDRQHRRRFLHTPYEPQTWLKLQESWPSAAYMFNGVHMRSFHAFRIGCRCIKVRLTYARLSWFVAVSLNKPELKAEHQKNMFLNSNSLL